MYNLTHQPLFYKLSFKNQNEKSINNGNCYFSKIYRSKLKQNGNK